MPSPAELKVMSMQALKLEQGSASRHQQEAEVALQRVGFSCALPLSLLIDPSSRAAFFLYYPGLCLLPSHLSQSHQERDPLPHGTFYGLFEGPACLWVKFKLACHSHWQFPTFLQLPCCHAKQIPLCAVSQLSMKLLNVQAGAACCKWNDHCFKALLHMPRNHLSDICKFWQSLRAPGSTAGFDSPLKSPRDCALHPCRPKNGSGQPPAFHDMARTLQVNRALKAAPQLLLGLVEPWHTGTAHSAAGGATQNHVFSYNG